MKTVASLKLKSALVLLLGLAGASAALADTITFTGTGANNSEGINTVPYYITVQSGSTVESYTVACDSFFNSIYRGESWSGTVNKAPTLSQAKFGSVAGFDSVKAYTEAAWLLSGWEYNSPSQVANAVNFAIWDLFAPAYSGSLNSWEQGLLATGVLDNGVAAYLAMANNWYENASSVDRQTYLDALLIFTPSSGGNTADGPQEFLTVVPEPATLALFAIGLVVMAGVLRLRKGQAQTQNIQANL